MHFAGLWDNALYAKQKDQERERHFRALEAGIARKLDAEPVAPDYDEAPKFWQKLYYADIKRIERAANGKALQEAWDIFKGRFS